MLVARGCRIYLPMISRSSHNRCRTGTRDVVGHGMNGIYSYKDDAHFPFPAVRFKENTKDIVALRVKEKGDWKLLCCEEKKTLYRVSFCQTFAEFQAFTGAWKFVLGWVLIVISFSFWMVIFAHHYIQEPLPVTLAPSAQKIQLRRILELRMNFVDGISSLWDYDNDRWKSDKPKGS